MQGTARLWDAATGQAACPPLKDGKKLATAAAGLTIRLFDPETGQDLAPPGEMQFDAGGVAISPDGTTLVTRGFDTARVWDTTTANLRYRFKAQHEWITASCLSPDGRMLFCGLGYKEIGVWDTVTGKELRRFPTDGLSGQATLAVTADNKVLALTTPDSAVLLDAVSGKQIKKFTGAAKKQPQAAFLHEGKQILIATEDHKGSIWDVATGRKQTDLSFPLARRPWMKTAEDWPYYSIIISPDSRLIAYGGPEKEITFLESQTAKEIATFKDLPDAVWPWVFSPDGRTLASIGHGPIRLMEVISGKERLQLAGHRGRVDQVAFFADGKKLASGGLDTTVLVWDLAIGDKKPLSTQEITTLWTDLAGADAAQAYKSIRMLAGDPARVVPFLAERLRPIPPVDDKYIAKLITDLGSEVFAVRDKAARELEKLGDLADPTCRTAFKEAANLEVRRRLEGLIAKMHAQSQNPSPEILRAIRAQECLEMIGTLEARKVLANMSQGAVQARVTQDAKAAVERLDQVKKYN
jgi:WD40 repeat protein